MTFYDMSVSVFKLEIYISKSVKIITAFVFILQEMKAPTKRNWSLGVYLTPLKYVKPRPTGKIFTFSLDEMRNDMPSDARPENCLIWTMKVGKLLQK